MKTISGCCRSFVVEVLDRRAAGNTAFPVKSALKMIDQAHGTTINPGCPLRTIATAGAEPPERQKSPNTSRSDLRAEGSIPVVGQDERVSGSGKREGARQWPELGLGVCSGVLLGPIDLQVGTAPRHIRPRRGKALGRARLREQRPHSQPC